MTRRAWVLIVTAYACLAIGALVSLTLFSRQADDIERTNTRLVQAAAAYCQAVIQPESKETEVLDQLSRSTYHPDKLDPSCRRIVDRVGDP